ncbi:MAG: mechanosensitive ion channel [Reyranellaceae bacterium]
MIFESEQVVGTLVTLATTYGLRVVGAIVVLTAGWFAARLLYRLIERLCARIHNMDQTLVLFLANAARYATLAFTFVAVLTTFGIATTSFIAAFGAIGLAIGLALQGTLSHFAAGIMLVVFRPFHVGDRIETGGVEGTIAIVNIFYSELDGPDGARIVIPNGKLWGEIVKVTPPSSVRRQSLESAPTGAM